MADSHTATTLSSSPMLVWTWQRRGLRSSSHNSSANCSTRKHTKTGGYQRITHHHQHRHRRLVAVAAAVVVAVAVVVVAVAVVVVAAVVAVAAGGGRGGGAA